MEYVNLKLRTKSELRECMFFFVIQRVGLEMNKNSL